MNEDKQERELAVVTDCGWVRALDVTGKPVRISKSDIIELIRKEMPVATAINNGLLDKNGFFFRGQRVVEGGWNNLANGTSDIIKPGMYELHMGDAEWGSLIVFNVGNVHAGVVQFIFRWSSQSFYFRTSSESLTFTTGFRTL